MIAEVKGQLADLRAQMVSWRRHLHAHPELSFQERDTVAYVADILRTEGVEVRTGVGRSSADAEGTGAIALVKGEADASDRCFALRADLDALPIQEVPGRSYGSTHAGVMHACGHDAHTAMVLAAGIALHRLRDRWSGTVMLVFQPGEEKEPGGARLLIDEGIFKDPVPTGILGQHVTPELEVGKVGFRAGPFMAAADEVYITVKGHGGHASQRKDLVDPILLTTQLLPSLYEEADQLTPEGQRMVLSFGKVIANGATNIVPDVVTIDGTLRTFDEGTRVALHKALSAKAAEVVRSRGGEVDFRIVKGSPVLYNDPDLTGRMRAAAAEYMGAGNVVEVPVRLGAEDFAFYTQVMPGCFYRLGTGDPTRCETTCGLHRPEFDIDERALAIGAGVMAWGALKELERGQ